MENIPQPSGYAYEEGDRVRIYISDDDIDSRYHGLVCEVLEDSPDDLGDATGRDIDSHHYRLQRVDTGEVISPNFRHADLVPASEWPARE